MIQLTPCKKTGLPRVAFGKVLYVDTEDKIVRLKATVVWLDNERNEWKREERDIVTSANDTIDYIDTGEIDDDGNPILQPVDGYTWWYEQPIPPGVSKLGDALKTVVDKYLAENIQ